MTVRRILGGCLLALVALAAASCSSGKSDATKDRIHAEAGTPSAGPSAAELAKQTAEVCRLFDTSKVNAFLKTKSEQSYSDPTKCIRTAGDTKMIVSLWRDQNRGEYDKYIKLRADATKVAGLGAAADYSAELQAVQFLKGSKVVTVSLTGDGVGKNAKAFLVAQARYAAQKV